MAAGHRPRICKLTAGSVEQNKPLLTLPDGADTRDKDRVRRDLTAAERGAQADAAKTLGNQKLLIEAANLGTGTREGRPGRAGTVAYGETVAQTATSGAKPSASENAQTASNKSCATAGAYPG